MANYKTRDEIIGLLKRTLMLITSPKVSEHEKQILIELASTVRELTGIKKGELLR